MSVSESPCRKPGANDKCQKNAALQPPQFQNMPNMHKVVVQNQSQPQLPRADVRAWWPSESPGPILLTPKGRCTLLQVVAVQGYHNCTRTVMIAHCPNAALHPFSRCFTAPSTTGTFEGSCVALPFTLSGQPAAFLLLTLLMWEAGPNSSIPLTSYWSVTRLRSLIVYRCIQYRWGLSIDHYKV